ncbi:MAG: GyrI-like domain-containing protein [Candidatus Thorarchaeota archaeon]|jgi:DNA gyrase inhibitor GyrI/DNA-binding HxlR family transcriptional regulator
MIIASMDVESSMELIEMLETYGHDISQVLNALANTRRMELITALLAEKNTFKELQDSTNLGKTALAHHLDVLVEAGLILRIERGHYELSTDTRDFLKAIGRTYDHSRRKKEREVAKRADYIQKIHTKEITIMEDIEVAIVKLEPMRVASAQATGESPETAAWKKMRAWAEPRGLLEDLETHPVFGFNNPDPQPGEKEYGYEFWIKVGPEEEPEEESGGDIQMKEFSGGLYAVTTCNLQEELESEFFKENGFLSSWKKLTDWVKSSSYSMDCNNQCLEKAHDPDASVDELILDLYCPIKK